MLWLGYGGPLMCALAIRDDISPEELRRQARRERDGRVSARLIAIANALEGMDRASAARLAGMDRQSVAGPSSAARRSRRCRRRAGASCIERRGAGPHRSPLASVKLRALFRDRGPSESEEPNRRASALAAIGAM